MGKEAFVCPICGKESRYGYALADGNICSDCETIAEPFLEGLDGGDLYDPSEMTVDLIRKMSKARPRRRRKICPASRSSRRGPSMSRSRRAVRSADPSSSC